MDLRKKERRRNPRILTITPTYEPQKTLLEDVLFNLGNQDYENYLSLILVNNSSREYFDWVKKQCQKIMVYLGYPHFKVWDIGHIPKKGDYKGSIGAYAYNRGLEYAEKGGYDYVVLVPGDIALPDNALREMLKPFRKFKDTGVSCLTCYFRWGEGKKFQGIIDTVGEVFPQTRGKVGIKVPMVIPLQKDYPLDYRKYKKKKYLKSRAGDGAMMVPRKVFSRIRMRDQLHDFDKLGFKGVGSDYAYCFDTLEKLGLWTYINTTIYTPHMYLDPDQEIKWF